MVGNDVVDLRDADATPRSAPRFDARVFCEAELHELDAAPDRARRRWQLWAAKEAAYKLRVKRDPATVFSPVRFHARLPAVGARLEGDVESADAVSLVVVEDRDGAVHAVARDESGRVVSGMTRLDESRLDPRDPHAPGREARRFACDEIARELGLDRGALEVRQSGRVPELWVEGVHRADLSLSHHGQVVGFACAIAPVSRGEAA